MEEQYLKSPLEEGLVQGTPCLGMNFQTFPAVEFAHETGKSTLKWDREKMIFKSDEGWFYYCAIISENIPQERVGSIGANAQEVSWEDDINA